MKFSNASARLFTPRAGDAGALFAQASHIAVGAHPDDLEFMSGHAILAGAKAAGFAGVTCEAGSENPAEQVVRLKEQEDAARLGNYLAVATLSHLSKDLKAGRRAPLVADLKTLFATAKPQAVYTHNPADKHDTHVAVCVSVVEALRSLPADRRPARLYGCEVWRGLDWVVDAEKTRFDVSDGMGHLAKLMKAYPSQLQGKAYDLALDGRKRANATFFDARSNDQMTHCEYALDMTELLTNTTLAVEAWIDRHLESLRSDVKARIARISGR